MPVGEPVEAQRKTANGPKRFFRATSLPDGLSLASSALKCEYGPSHKTTDVGSFLDIELPDCFQRFLKSNQVVILLRRFLLAVDDDPAL